MTKSNLTKYYEARHENDMNFFFGDGKWSKVSNRGFHYSPVIDDDNIIIRTNNVWFLGNGSIVLVVGDNKAVYLKNWQLKRFTGGEYVVKLNRNYFKVYTFKSNFDNFSFDHDESFDDLLNVAKEQSEYDIENGFYYIFAK